jgi:polysaccharide export outer membrane protein
MFKKLFILSLILVLVNACSMFTTVKYAPLGQAAAPAAANSAPAPQLDAVEASVPSDEDYRLGAEDKVKVNVYGETDLSGEFVLDSSGVLSAPFIGQIQAKGLTVREFEAAYAKKLRDAEILKDPKVSAEVTSFRPIYVLGEVKKPGQYAYVSGMTVQKAVALAEGYTYRASESSVEVTRGGKKFKVDVSPQTKVLPGDEIRIPERFF